MMFGFNKFAFADTLNNNINNTSEQQMTYSTGYINATISGEYKQGYKPIATEELNKYREIILHAIKRNKTQ